MTRDRPTVLLVDDDADIRELAAIMLTKRGFEVLTAGDAAEAIMTCRVHSAPIDVLVTDLGLPGVSGGELSRSAAALRPALRIVYISGVPRDTAVGSGTIAADAMLVTKPFTGDTLGQAVRSVLGS